MKFIEIIFVLFFVYSCSTTKTNTNHDIHKQLISELVKVETEPILSSYSSILIFCKANTSTELGYINVDKLIKIYNTEYYPDNYKEFLTKVLNQELILDSLVLDETFSLNDTITDSYKNNSFSDFITKYNKKIRSNEYTINQNLSRTAKLTVLYYLFLNNYYIYFDDYIGMFYSTKELNSKTIETYDLMFEE